MRRHFPISLLILGLLLPAAATAQDYSLRAGDRVEIKVFTGAGIERAELSGERTIDRQGNIFLALIGSVPVAGLDATAIRERLEVLYTDVYPGAVFSVDAKMRVSITGAVGQGNIYFLDPTTTIMEAMAYAGGINSELAVNSLMIPSDPSRVRLVRDNEIEILDLRADALDAEILNRRVQSGDYIFVPSRPRSKIRDEITFWGSVVGFATSVLLLAGAIGN